MSVFSQQSLLTISLDTKDNEAATASNKRIYYKTRSGVKGFWPATANLSVLTYEVQPRDINEKGKWSFQAGFTIDGREALGEIVIIDFKEPII